MVRPKQLRWIRKKPEVIYFKPAGVPIRQLKETIISVEEFEAIRLKDEEGMEQTEAASKMKISQPTFNRLLNSARRKIAIAISKGRAIKIEGGIYKIK